MDQPNAGNVCIEIRPIQGSTGGSVNYRIFLVNTRERQGEYIYLVPRKLKAALEDPRFWKFPVQIGRITVNLVPEIRLAEMNYWPFKELLKAKIWSFEGKMIASEIEAKVLDDLKKRFPGFVVKHNIISGSRRENQLLARGINPRGLARVEEEHKKLMAHLKSAFRKKI